MIIEWDAHNCAHFAEHQRCTRKQVEDVLLSVCHDSRRRRVPERPERAIYEGQTCVGRFLVVVAVVYPENDAVRPITCWPLVGTRLERYLAWKQTTRAR